MALARAVGCTQSAAIEIGMFNISAQQVISQLSK
jgi:hypothetical protein